MQHDFDMVHLMAKLNHFYNPTAAFLNISPKLDKLDMLKKNHFLHQFHICTDIPATMPLKENKFYICIS